MSRIWNLEQYKDNVALVDEFGNSLEYHVISSIDTISKPAAGPKK